MAQSTTREAPERHEEQRPAAPPDKPKSLEERVEALEATLARARILLGED